MSATQRSAEDRRMIRDEREAALKLLRPSERALMERQVWGFLHLARACQKDVLAEQRKHRAAGAGTHFFYSYLQARTSRFWNLSAAKSVKEDFAWYARGEEKTRRERKHERNLARIRKSYGLPPERRVA